ncbi:hypothetical protein HDF16_002107 [Granulicella aggregans]|uniref:Uncharacterized protein n=1 Tax=Granulicella aggregans TaxID=474949 RepID=A0A7W7ZDL8_9BACT|nr:hypothetical protein [Granulicella aggregans]
MPWVNLHADNARFVINEAPRLRKVIYRIVSDVAFARTIRYTT